MASCGSKYGKTWYQIWFQMAQNIVSNGYKCGTFSYLQIWPQMMGGGWKVRNPSHRVLRHVTIFHPKVRKSSLCWRFSPQNFTKVRKSSPLDDFLTLIFFTSHRVFGIWKFLPQRWENRHPVDDFSPQKWENRHPFWRFSHPYRQIRVKFNGGGGE